MKRPHEDVEGGEEGEENPAKRVKESDLSVLEALKEKYSDTGTREYTEMERIKERYLASYLKNVIRKLPDSEKYISEAEEVNEDDDFYRTFSVAKTCVQTHFEMKRLVIFQAVVDMIANVAGRGFHNQVIVKYLGGMIDVEHLDNAYEAYQTALNSKEGKASIELHCICYLIQKEIENREPLKIPSPLRSRMNQHLKAISEYVTTLLSSIAAAHTTIHTDYEFIGTPQKDKR